MIGSMTRQESPLENPLTVTVRVYTSIGDGLSVWFDSYYKRYVMITMDDDSRKYFKEKLAEKQALRVFFGGYG
jgi:hypothetical protein